MFTVLNRTIYRINSCPLCGSRKYSNKYSNYQNRYSEQISLNLKINEKKILSKMINLKCSKCGLIYKKYWFKEKFLKYIYSRLIPVHPKGWETELNNFTKTKFLKAVNNFLSSRENMYQREISGYLNAINFKNKSQKTLIKKFESDILKFNENNIKLNVKHVTKLIDKPKEFSRFNNFNSSNLFKYILNKNKKIETLSEIGCPLWGLLPLASKKKIKSIFFRGNETEFWGKNCKYKGISCLEQCKKKNNILVKSKLKNKIDYLGIYLYLDHVVDLKKFVKHIFFSANSVGIILEDMTKFTKTKKMAIQHFTSLNSQTIKYLSNKYNFKLFQDFKELNESKHNFYFLKRRFNEVL